LAVIKQQKTIFIPFYQIATTINAAATKITRRITMHKNTRYILGNPSQTREKNPAKSFAVLQEKDLSPPK
jgi:hypothetical protein